MNYIKFIKLVLLCLITSMLSACYSEESKLKIKINRWDNGLIIPPNLSNEIGSNVQGPSLIKVPEWINNKLGNYYQYSYQST